MRKKKTTKSANYNINTIKINIIFYPNFIILIIEAGSLHKSRDAPKRDTLF